MALATALVFAAPNKAVAEECLLDTNDNGVADAADTDGGAIGTGANSLACGENAVATGDNSTAIGAFSTATGDSSTATGVTAVASGDASSAYGVASSAEGDFSTAIGAVATTESANSTAVGFAASIQEFDPDGSFGAIAIGSGASVGFDFGSMTEVNSLGAVAIGSDVTGDGIGAVANSLGAVALGPEALADGTGTTAIGTAAEASGLFSTALGSGAVALAEGSTALGSDAVATLPGEFVMGTTGNTYTAPGITSSLSRVRQSGPLGLVTTDFEGHLASDGGAVFSQLANLSAGVALAMAMESPELVTTENFAARIGYGNFEGDGHAFGVSMIGNFEMNGHRWAWDAGFGAGWSEYFGYDSGATWGGRAGLQVAW